MWAPDVLEDFKKLTANRSCRNCCGDLLSQLIVLFSLAEFEEQVNKHRMLIESEFGQTPKSFRNTELAYNNDLAYWADKKGYKAIISEGWDKV